jgi:hypothetical protein
MKSTRFFKEAGQILRCTDLNQLKPWITPSISIQIGCEVLKAAANIMKNNQNIQKNHDIEKLYFELSNKCHLFGVRDLISFIHFFRVIRENKNYNLFYTFRPELIRKVQDMILKNRALEASEIISAYYDIKRTKLLIWEIDASILELLRNRNMPLNVAQLSIFLKVIQNSITIYNQEILNWCMKRILEIDFCFKLDSVIFNIFEMILELDYRLSFYDTKELTTKIIKYLNSNSFSELEMLKIIEIHLKYQKTTDILTFTIKKFMENYATTCNNIQLLSSVLHIYLRDSLEQDEIFKNFVVSCAQILKNEPKYSKYHFLMIKNLKSLSHLLPPELSSTFSDKNTKNKTNFLDYLEASYSLALCIQNFTCLNIKVPIPSTSDTIEKILESYIILKTSQFFKIAPKVELNYKQIINMMVKNTYESKKGFVSFLSNPMPAASREALNELITENIEDILSYHYNDFSLIRIILALYTDHPIWFKKADSIIRKTEKINVLKILLFSHTNSHTFNGLKYILKKIKHRNHFLSIQCIHLFMHPTFIK